MNYRSWGQKWKSATWLQSVLRAKVLAEGVTLGISGHPLGQDLQEDEAVGAVSTLISLTPEIRMYNEILV